MAQAQYRIEETAEGSYIYAHAGNDVYDVFFVNA